jgi:putative SOS response-associated peptidase YedK
MSALGQKQTFSRSVLSQLKILLEQVPAILADEDWDMWLRGTLDEAKTCLRTVEGVRWTMTKEEKAATTKRKKATASDPTGLL